MVETDCGSYERRMTSRRWPVARTDLAGIGSRPTVAAGATRWTAWAGLLFVGLLIPSVVTEILGPDPGGTAAAVASKFHTERTDVLVSGALLLLTLTAALVFVVGVTELVRAGADATLVGVSRTAAVIGIALVAAYTAMFAGIAAAISDLNSVALVYGLFKTAYAIDAASDLFFGVFLVCAALALGRAGHAGRWLTRFGVAAGIVYGLGGFGIVQKAKGPFDGLDALGTILFAIWAVAVSIRLLRRSSA